MEINISNNSLLINNSETIGFVVACLFSSAINVNELRLWGVDIIGRNEIEDIPDYIFDLVDYDDAIAKIFKVIGFTPSWSATNSERNALDGIRVKRKIKIYEKIVSDKKALDCLNDNPHILVTFKYIFPFIDIDF